MYIVHFHSGLVVSLYPYAIFRGMVVCDCYLIGGRCCDMPYTSLSQFGLSSNCNAHISIIGIAVHSIVSSAGSSATHRSQRHTNRNDFRRCSRREVRSVYCVKSKYAIQHSSPGCMSRDAVNTMRPLSSGLWVIFTGSALPLPHIEGDLRLASMND